MRKNCLFFSFFIFQFSAYSQLGVGTNNPDASAQLDITATNKGFLAPRIALTSATDVLTIASPATGLMIYNTATAGTLPNNVVPGYYYFDGVKWVRFSAGDQSSKWTNDVANSRINLTNLSDGTTPRTGVTNFTVTDNNVLQIGDMTNVPSPAWTERGIIVRKTGNASITSISDGGGYSIFENQIYGGSVSNSATYNVFAKSRGSLASPQAVLNGDLIGVFDFRGFSGTSYANSARIMTRVDGAVTNNSVPVSFDFQTIGPTETAPSSRLRIASNGNVGIGTTSPATKFEISSGISGISGLRFTNLTSSSAATSASSKVLAVNSSGDLILTNVPGTQNIVSFNTADPNAGSPTFTPNSPIDQSVIYQSATNNSLWIYNGSTYVTYTAPTTTPFFLASTSNDAGSNKTLPINRTGSITVDNGFVRASNSSYLSIISLDPTESTGPRLKIGTTSVINSFLEIGAYNSQNNFDTKNRDLHFFGSGTGNTVGLMLKASSGYVGIRTINPQAALHVNSNMIATSSDNADAPVLRLSRPENPGVKWDNIAQFNLGSFLVSGNAHSRLDLAMNNGGGTSLETTPVMTWRADGSVGIKTSSPTERLTIANVAGSTSNVGIYSSPLVLPTASDVVLAQINLGANKDYFTSIKSVLPNGSIGVDLSDFQIATGQASNNNTQIPRVTVKAQTGNVGIGTTTPSSNFEVNGSMGANIRTVSATSTLLASDYTVIIVGSASTFQTLPSPVNRRILNIKNKSTASATLIGHIDNVITSSFNLSSESSITLQSDGTTWWILDKTEGRYVAAVYQTVSGIQATGNTPATSVDILSIILPSPGRWRLSYSVRAYNSVVQGGLVTFISDVANNLQTNSEMLVVFAVSDINTQLTSSGFYDVVTTTSNQIFKLRCYSINAGSSYSLSDGNGRTFMSAYKLD